MNWLQKISGPPPPAYLGIGHEERSYLEEEEGLSKIIIWQYFNGRIVDVERSEEVDSHGDLGNAETWEGSGRIEVDTGIGSIAFRNDHMSDLNKRIISAVINKYSGIKFFVYPNRYGAPPVNVQKYWDMLEQGQV